MGSNVGFLAFRSAPDVAKLQAIGWLEGFTLFKRRDREQWYLEGVLGPDEPISFYEPLSYATPINDQRAKSEIAWLSGVIDDMAAFSTFDDGALLEGLSISRLLGNDVLVVFGNDEDLDGAVICSDGKLSGGALQNGPDILRITGERKAVIETDVPEDDGDMPNTFYRIAIREACRFFGEEDLTPHWSDISAANPDVYERVTSKSASAMEPAAPYSAPRKQNWLDYFFKR